MFRQFRRFGVAIISAGLAMAPAHTEPAIWTMSDSDTVISIVGTVHHLPEDLDWRSGNIGKVFDAAHTVCFEIDANARAYESHVMRNRRGFFRPGNNLTDHLTRRQAKTLKRRARALDVPFHVLNLMKPWLASITLDNAFIEQLELGDGVEFSLYPDLLASGKELCELETLEEQLGGWVGMTLDDQVRQLFSEYPGTEDLTEIESLAFSKDLLMELIEDWAEGDVDAIGDLVNIEAAINEGFHDALLFDRNTRWVPRIEALLETEGNIMVAVGAAHLAGDDSVITMLRARGHKIDGP